MIRTTCVRLGIFAVWVQMLLLAMVPLGLRADIRIVTWNISNYDGTNVTASDIRNAIYGVYQGRSMNPDIVITQEFETQISVNNFLAALNNDPTKPNEWAAAPFINGPNTESAFFYRTRLFTFLGVTTVAMGSTTADANTQPRNTYRYDVQLKGYPNNPPVLACYAVHMKAGSDSGDLARRLVEARRIRTNAESLPSTWHFLMAGDTNIQSATQTAYQELVISKPNNSGRLFDPIHPFGTSPSTWNNSSTYRFIHTQDPSGNSTYGGMDDRLDMILLSMNLNGGTGLRYKGNGNLAFSRSTWNDLNHSYRCWGNDGTSFNAKLTTTFNGTQNAMVGASIAQSLINASGLTGHLPVYLDLITPPMPPTTFSISGRVTLESVVNRAQPLNFLFTPTTGTPFTRSLTLAANGEYTLTEVPAANYTVGVKGNKWLRKNVTVNATSANVTDLNVTLRGGDANNDNAADISDLGLLIGAYNTVQGSPSFVEAADFTCDGICDIADLLVLINNYNRIGD